MDPEGAAGGAGGASRPPRHPHHGRRHRKSRRRGAPQVDRMKTIPEEERAPPARQKPCRKMQKRRRRPQRDKQRDKQLSSWLEARQSSYPVLLTKDEEKSKQSAEEMRLLNERFIAEEEERKERKERLAANVERHATEIGQVSSRGPLPNFHQRLYIKTMTKHLGKMGKTEMGSPPPRYTGDEDPRYASHKHSCSRALMDVYKRQANFIPEYPWDHYFH